MEKDLTVLQGIETLQQLSDEAKSILSTMEDLDEVEQGLSNETITQWLETELDLVLRTIIKVNKKNERAPFWNYAYQVATDFYAFDDDKANEVAELSYSIYINSKVNLNGLDLVDFVCEEFDNLPSDFDELSNYVIESILDFDL